MVEPTTVASETTQEEKEDVSDAGDVMDIEQILGPSLLLKSPQQCLSTTSTKEETAKKGIFFEPECLMVIWLFKIAQPSMTVKIEN